MKRVLAMLVENKPGALARVVGLFHQRGYNIESLNVAPVHDGSYSRLTVATRGTESAVEQIMKQINKLIDIIKVADLTEGDHHELELALIKISKVVDLTSMKKIIKPLNGKKQKNDSTTCVISVTQVVESFFRIFP
ncbi:MAG: acetolactate synthase small subunit [SAR86 cluster bacterium]|nr:acetolactate synthase small subunit [SAR86 cluster bacterium]